MKASFGLWIASIFLVGCLEGPQGPKGDQGVQGVKGDSGAYYQKITIPSLNLIKCSHYKYSRPIHIQFIGTAANYFSDSVDQLIEMDSLKGCYYPFASKPEAFEAYSNYDSALSGYLGSDSNTVKFNINSGVIYSTPVVIDSSKSYIWNADLGVIIDSTTNLINYYKYKNDPRNNEKTAITLSYNTQLKGFVLPDLNWESGIFLGQLDIYIKK